MKINQGLRLPDTAISQRKKSSLIIPHTQNIASLLVRYFLEKVAHQGRHITERAIRAAGLWITGSKRLVSSVIYKCVICRTLRGMLQIQKMADLSADRLSPVPPFIHIRLDVFGPWTVMTHHTRGGSADCKRWAVLFTYMSTRAVHMELVESMCTSFIKCIEKICIYCETSALRQGHFHILLVPVKS